MGRMGRIVSVVRILRLRGPLYPLALLRDFLFPRLISWAVFESRVSGLCRRLLCRWSRCTPAAGQRAGFAERGTSVSARSWLPEATRREAWRRRAAAPEEAVVLGRFDNDGRLLPLCGPLPGFDAVDSATFVERYRYGLDLVLDGDALWIRKDYRGDRPAFDREWRGLAALRGVGGCPEVLRADPGRLVLVKSFVPGPTLRQRLVAAGARILSVDTEADPVLSQLAAEARLEAVWARGREHFAGALPAATLAELVRRLDAIHRRGVTGFSLSFGNVVLHADTGEPWFIDFDAAEIHSQTEGWRFRACRDRDRDLFNRIYACDLLTERSAPALLKRIATPYSPVDLGGGLAGRGFWSVDSGTGRWETVNGPALGGLVEGRRVLDLGAFNAVMPLSMLASGARQVVALEKSPEMVEIGHQMRRLFEWRAMKRFDLELLCADMRAILDGGWGPFDVVTAFCSLYYLDEADMRRVVKRAEEMAPVMVLQAKTDTRLQAGGDKAAKSSVPFLRALLEEHFPSVEVVASVSYPRPILIGRSADHR